ncbi:hypothetical protein [Pelosinus fermentans]|nr:hypothetical protein [Pelosinus fermentans]
MGKKDNKSSRVQPQNGRINIFKEIRMTLSNDLIQQINNSKDQLDSLKIGNLDFIIQNGEVTRVDIRQSIRPEKKE